MKTEKEHHVPLSKPAIELLKSIQACRQSQGYMFPAPRDGSVLSDMSLTAWIKCMHEQKFKENSLGYIDSKQNRTFATHGFRSIFRD